jgi:hypothetical protein
MHHDPKLSNDVISSPRNAASVLGLPQPSDGRAVTGEQLLVEQSGVEDASVGVPAIARSASHSTTH